MLAIYVFLLTKILVAVYFCNAEEFSMRDFNVIELLPEIYDTYRQAVIQNKETVSRRLFKNDDRYMLHIQKLKEVNGVKTHNVRVTTVLNTSEPIIYINNPVESHIPYAFLSQEQFKKHLMNNIQKQRKELERQKIKQYLSHFKMKLQRTERIKRPNKVVSVPNPANFKSTNVSPKSVDYNKVLFLKRIITMNSTTNKKATSKSSSKTTDNSKDIKFWIRYRDTLTSTPISTNLKIKRPNKVGSVPYAAKFKLTDVSPKSVVYNKVLFLKRINSTTNKKATSKSRSRTTDHSKDIKFWIRYRDTLSSTPISTNLRDTVKLRSLTEESAISTDIITTEIIPETSTEDVTTSDGIINSTTVMSQHAIEISSKDNITTVADIVDSTTVISTNTTQHLLEIFKEHNITMADEIINSTTVLSTDITNVEHVPVISTEYMNTTSDIVDSTTVISSDITNTHNVLEASTDKDMTTIDDTVDSTTVIATETTQNDLETPAEEITTADDTVDSTTVIATDTTTTQDVLEASTEADITTIDNTVDSTSVIFTEAPQNDLETPSEDIIKTDNIVDSTTVTSTDAPQNDLDPTTENDITIADDIVEPTTVEITTNYEEPTTETEAIKETTTTSTASTTTTSTVSTTTTISTRKTRRRPFVFMGG